MAAQSGVRLEKAIATRAALIAAARTLFGERGFHATGTPELVGKAGVTRGALYHHFSDKAALFEATFRDVAEELQDGAAAVALSYADDPWRQLLEGLQAFLDIVAARADIQRILLIDGPAVFGWSKWREIESEFTLGHLERILARLMALGVIGRQPFSPLAHLVLAALNEAALLIAHAPDPKAEGSAAGEALRSLVAGLRTGP